MLKKMLNSLPILLLTLCLLPMSASAQSASGTANLKEEMSSGGVKANRTKTRNVKANNAGSPFQVLHGFTGGADGCCSYGGVNLDSSGNLYGSTEGSGTTYGTIYEVNTAGNYTVLYDFQNGGDGEYPATPPLPPDASGNMYGTAARGGAGGDGTIYEFNPTTNILTTLYAFSGPDGSEPYGGLVPDSSGNLYGFTALGGANGYGTVFMWNTTTSTLTTLYAFTGGGDGNPSAVAGTLRMDAAGNLYGASSQGGGSGYGNVYELSPVSSEPGGVCPAGSYQTSGSSWCETVLYNFSTILAPYGPESSVAIDAFGNLYGTGFTGGNSTSGGVWKLTPVSSEPGGVCPAGSNTGNGWCETVLYSFSTAGTTDGKSPKAGVVLDSMGNLYGVTGRGGANNFGVLYEISASGQFTLLHSFTPATDGELPYATPTLSSSGTTLYGTTDSKGSGGSGTVWSYALVEPFTVTFAGAGSGTVSSTPAGISCPGTCTASFPTNSTVTLTETPSTGDLFGGWSGACSGTGACSVTMSGSESVTATFNGNTTTTAVSCSPNPVIVGQSVTCSATVTGVGGTVPPPTGTITFSFNGATLGTETLGTPIIITGLPVGLDSILATYSGDTYNASSSGTFGETVNSPTSPIITWLPSPLTPITFGTALSAAQLDATASAPPGSNVRKAHRKATLVKSNDSLSGTYAYSAQLGGGALQPVQSGTVLSPSGDWTLYVTFTPTDTVDYTSATASNTLTVGPATPIINWPAPAPVAYGTALSGAQLDATASFNGANVAGAFVYSPAAGTVLNAGSQTLSVTFTPTDTTDYTTVTGGATLTVNQAAQTIALTFNPLPVLTNGAAAGDTFTVTSTGGASGNPVVLTASGVCINSGATYVMTGGPNSTGTCSVIANQAGNSNYLAGSTSQSIKEVKKVTLTAPTVSLTTNAPSAGAPYESQFTVTATTNASTTPTITASPSSVCTISGSTVTMTSGTGKCTLTAKWKADEYYSAATATQTVSAAKLASTISWAPASSITYGPLGSILNATAAGSDGTPLTGTWSYTEAPGVGIPPQTVTARTALPVGTYLLTANFTPTGTFAKDYAAATAVTVPMAVTQATTTTTISSATAGTNPLKVTVYFTVAGQNGGKATGAVNVSDSTGAFTCSATLAANGTGHCPITFTGTAGANVTLTATYAGDTNNGSSISAPYSTTD